MTINLAMWNSNYYRYSQVSSHRKDSLQFRQVYLRYQDVPCNVIFEIDDSAITENGFSSDPSELTDNTLTLTDVNPLYVKTYSQGDSRFAVAFGQCFGLDWVHLIDNPPDRFSVANKWELMLSGPGRAQSIADVPSRGNDHGRLWVHHLVVSTWIIRIYRVVWDLSRIGVRMEIFMGSSFHHGIVWKTLDIEASGFLGSHMNYYHNCAENRWSQLGHEWYYATRSAAHAISAETVGRWGVDRICKWV